MSNGRAPSSPAARRGAPGGRILRTVTAMLAALLLALPAVGPGSALAAGGDPDDMAAGLDIRSVSERNDPGTVTLTVETYDTFSDADVDITWAIDANGDGTFDILVAAEWGPGLVGEIEDAAEEPVGEARVSRPAPNAVAVSFPSAVVGGACSCRYTVTAVTDFNHNGENDPGETDIAPDAGLYGWS
ncbi:MAG: hypothetical protein ACRDJO_03755 [Actinomycetota bacterium]